VIVVVVLGRWTLSAGLVAVILGVDSALLGADGLDTDPAGLARGRGTHEEFRAVSSISIQQGSGSLPAATSVTWIAGVRTVKRP
jgi:hypothetical protein